MTYPQLWLQQLKSECLEKLATVTKASEYPALLQKLIVQGLIKIEEPIVEIIARAEDKAIVSRIVSVFHIEYHEISTLFSWY